MKQAHEQIPESQIGNLIYEAYDAIPSANPVHLARINARLPVSQKQLGTARRQNTPW